jgi:hypothetical protein
MAVAEQQSSADPIPRNCESIEVHVSELKQLFNAMDPSPFHEKDLDPSAEDFIVSRSRDLPGHSPLCLLIYLDRAAGLPEEAAILRDAIHEFFRRRSEASMRQLRQLFRIGRVSLLIGLVCLALSIVVGDVVANAMSGRRLGEVLRESLLIGGWVAMWRPLEIFLYDWWPIRGEARLFDRLSAMSVRIVYTSANTTEAWRSDWPAVPAGRRVEHNQ